MWIQDLLTAFHTPGQHAERPAALRTAAAWLLGLSLYALVLSSCGMSLMTFGYVLPQAMVAEHMPPEQVEAFEEGRPYMLVMAIVLGALLFLPALVCLFLSRLVRMGRVTPALIAAGLLTLMLAGLTLLQCVGLLLQAQLAALFLTLVLMGPAVAVGVICLLRLLEAAQMAPHPPQDGFAPEPQAHQEEPWDALEP